MKLLQDQNLSPRLVDSLSSWYPGSAHVRDLGLSRSDDAEIWDIARDQGFAILSKDSDFHQMSFLRGSPPKVIWVRRGNCSTEEIEDLLKVRQKEIAEFLKDGEAAFLALS